MKQELCNTCVVTFFLPPTDAHSRGNSLSDNDLLQFALNVESELPVLGSKRHSHASQSGSNRNSYVGDGGGSKRDSYVSASGSKRNSYASGGSKRNSYVDRERRRSRGISMSEQELEGLISSLTNYPDNQDPSSQRSSLVVDQVMSQKGSYADGGHHTRTLSGESQYSEGAAMYVVLSTCTYCVNISVNFYNIVLGHRSICFF